MAKRDADEQIHKDSPGEDNGNGSWGASSGPQKATAAQLAKRRYVRFSLRPVPPSRLRDEHCRKNTSEPLLILSPTALKISVIHESLPLFLLKETLVCSTIKLLHCFQLASSIVSSTRTSIKLLTFKLHHCFQLASSVPPPQKTLSSSFLHPSLVILQIPILHHAHVHNAIDRSYTASINHPQASDTNSLIPLRCVFHSLTFSSEIIGTIFNRN